MKRYLFLAYGILAYAAFLLSFTYAMAWVGNILVPKTIDSGTSEPPLTAALINIGLLALFAVQHTIMARPRFKAWWARIVAPALERSTFVLAASALLALICWQWRPITRVIWDINTPPLHWLLVGVYACGLVIGFTSTFLIDHFDLFGLRQVWHYFRGRPYEPPAFQERSFYRHVRHPLMVGLLLVFWATPTMTAGHLLFATVMTIYILLGVRLEERDLASQLGRRYEEYRERVPMLLPRLSRRTVEQDA
jgi:protein-S-isoprenylcysteine O-methyltransferase Ste14